MLEKGFVYIKNRILPNLLVACVLWTTGMLWNIKKQLDTIESVDQRITTVEQEISIIKSQMVTWDLLKRIELSLSTMSQMGNGNESMKNVANVIHNEIEAKHQK